MIKRFINIIFLLFICLQSCNSDKHNFNKLISNYSKVQSKKEIINWLDNINKEGYYICYNTNCIPQQQKELIAKYEISKAKERNRQSFKEKFSHFYTSDITDWNSTELSINKNTTLNAYSYNSPNMYVNFIVKSKKHLSIAYSHGGLIETPFLITYIFNSNEIYDHWLIYRNKSENNSNSDVDELVKSLLTKELTLMK